jgi:glycosyltransferase involved in cell wall biosynthesis
MKREHQNIGIVTFPISEAGNIPLANLAAILYHLSDKLYVITGNRGTVFFKQDGGRLHLFYIQHKRGANLFTRVINYTYTQLKISFRLAKLARCVDLWVFFIGGEGLLLPMLTARLLGKRVILSLVGFPARFSEAQRDSLFKATGHLTKINLNLSKRIVVYSESIVAERGLEKYGERISIAHEHFLDFDRFKIERQLSQRGNLIGYIGRLSEEKGVLNYIGAIPDLLQWEDGIEFFIGGDGELRDKVEAYLNEANLNSKVRFTGWIPHDELPKYLNELRLLVLPSYTEGLPNIMLEAMACGTPVLATPVGAIPDIIKDGETGFIMKDNLPECIASNVIRALNYPNLEGIAKNARALVEREYTYEAAVERYREILNTLDGNQQHT